MAIKEFISRPAKWLGFKKTNATSIPASTATIDLPKSSTSKVEIVAPPKPVNKERSLEMVQQGLTELVGQLGGINDNLSKQINQHEQLMSHIRDLPDILNALPQAVQSQSEAVNALIEQLNSQDSKQEKFIETINKIPTETGKQTSAIQNVSHQLSAATEIDVQMAEGFNKFKMSIDNLDKTASAQTDGIVEMTKTFQTSDGYLKELVTKQNKRFMWIFITSIAVSTISIAALIVALILILMK